MNDRIKTTQETPAVRRLLAFITGGVIGALAGACGAAVVLYLRPVVDVDEQPETEGFRDGDAAPKNDAGLFPYIVITSNEYRPLAPPTAKIVWAQTLTEAKRSYGWSPTRHELKVVRRARITDTELLLLPGADLQRAR